MASGVRVSHIALVALNQAWVQMQERIMNRSIEKTLIEQTLLVLLTRLHHAFTTCPSQMASLYVQDHKMLYEIRATIRNQPGVKHNLMHYLWTCRLQLCSYNRIQNVSLYLICVSIKWLLRKLPSIKHNSIKVRRTSRSYSCLQICTAIDWLGICNFALQVKIWSAIFE